MVSKAAIVLLAVYALLALGLPPVFLSRTVSFPLKLPGFLYALGRYFALTAFMVFFFQYIWTARIRFFERIMSYDRRVVVHRTLGFLGVLMVSLHPILILLFYATREIPFVITFPIALGLAALVALFVVAGAVFLGRLWGARYETWKHIHWTAFSVVTLAFFHSLLMGSDIFGYVRYLWFVLWGLHLGVLILKLTHRADQWFNVYEVREVNREGPGITTLKMDKPGVPYRAGQFGFLSARLNGRWEMFHPFSMTSLRSDQYLSLTIKSVGDFTDQVDDIKPGDQVKLDVGYGGFSPDFVPDDRYVMIAGGVGMTPLYAICRDLHQREEPPQVVLLYTVHNENEILFRKDLDEWFTSTTGWKHEYIMTAQSDWEGEQGRLTPEKVSKLLQGDLSGTFFLCGPLGLIRSVRSFLLDQDVPVKKIRKEEFVFLP